jgi:hypothetical protein
LFSLGSLACAILFELGPVWPLAVFALEWTPFVGAGAEGLAVPIPLIPLLLAEPGGKLRES